MKFLKALQEEEVEYTRSGRDHAENEENHSETLQTTGFWGSRGAGCLVVAEDTGRTLLALRSPNVEQPGTWGNWGGAIDGNEDAKQAALNELVEEAGYDGEVSSVEPLFTFKKGDFRYYNFLVKVPSEFIPRLNWESSDADWFDFGELPSPLHFGVESILGNSRASSLLGLT